MAALISARRTFLRLSSLIPLVGLSSTTHAASAAPQSCQEVPEHPPVPPNDIEFDEVTAILWGEFVAGTKTMGETPTISQTTQHDITQDVSFKLRRKVRFWSMCEEETRLCCYSAGVIADAERRAQSDSEIKFSHYLIAKEAVKQIQTRRLGDAVPGIAC